MSESQELLPARQEPQAVARPEPDALDMMRAVIEKGVTAENVAVMQELVKLKKAMDEQKAEKEFAAAFVKLQAEMPKVNAVKPVGDRYKYAPLEEIIRQVGPSLKANGFSFSFSEHFENDRMVETFTLQHVGGHKRSNEFSVRVGKGPVGCSETQADGAAGQYARRYALCDGLGIVIEHMDSDARLEGGKITPDQAFELERRVALLNVNRDVFLKFAHSKSFAEIPAAVYPLCDDMLRRKEQKQP